LTSTAVDRHLFFSLPVFKVRMTQIPFAVEYDIKENNRKQATETRKMLQMSKFVIYKVTEMCTM